MFWAKKATSIEVWAQGTFPVELSMGKEPNAKKRVPLTAEVDAETGVVTFRVDPKLLGRLG